MNGAPASVPKESKLPRNVTEFKDRHGNWHMRFRKKGHPTHYFEAAYGTPEFREELARCLNGKPTPQVQVRTSERTKPGSFSALIATYYGSPEFTGLATSSRATYRNNLERFREDYGDLPVATISRQNIKDILGAMADRPAAANNLLDRIRILMRFAMDGGWREDDPTVRIRGFKIVSDGFHTWTEEEIAKFIERHPAGSKAHLALSLMLNTGSRRSDVVTMGWQHVEGDRIRVKQQKTKTLLSIPMHAELRAAIDKTPRSNMTFLVTEYGQPHSVKAFGAWFKKRATEAALEHCTPHGLRKAAARRLAEAGCSNQQIKAITGHKTDREVSRYTAAADQVRLSDQAMDALNSSNSSKKSIRPVTG